MRRHASPVHRTDPRTDGHLTPMGTLARSPCLAIRAYSCGSAAPAVAIECRLGIAVRLLVGNAFDADRTALLIVKVECLDHVDLTGWRTYAPAVPAGSRSTLSGRPSSMGRRRA